MLQLEMRKVEKPTPRANRPIGIAASPSMRKLPPSHVGRASSARLIAMPSIMAQSIGLRRMPRMSVLGEQIRMPSVKWIRLNSMNIETAAGSIAGPKANSVSGNPMLATFENIIDGTKAATL